MKQLNNREPQDSDSARPGQDADPASACGNATPTAQDGLRIGGEGDTVPAAPDPDETGDEQADDTPAVVLTDDELEQCSDAMKGVYLVRPSNLRGARLLRDALTQVLSARRADLPSGQLRDGRLIALFGESRAGKSAYAQRLLAGATLLADRGDGHSKPLVDLQVKGPATLASVGLQILQSLGYETEANLREAQVWQRVFRVAKQCDVLAIHLGEFANVSGTANVTEKVKLRNTIKSLIINELHPMVVILSGLPEIVRFLTEDEQIKERSAFVGLERLQPEDNDTVADGVRSIAASVGLAVEDELECEIVPRLVHAARYQLGRAMEFTVQAARRALAPEDESGSRLPPDRVLRLEHLADHYEDITGNAAWANPFRAREWDTVDASAAGLVFRSQVDADAPDEPAASRRSGKTPAKGEKR